MAKTNKINSTSKTYFQRSTSILVLVLILTALLKVESKLFIRKNVRSLSHEEWHQFKRAVALMKAISDREPRNPFGFFYQSNIHGWPDYDGSDRANRVADKLNWHKCQHAHYFFLVWHRMYIYFYERILRRVSNNWELTVPYWDCFEAESRSLPQQFRLPANKTNPLYASERCQSVNNGKPLSEKAVNPYPALSTNFFTTYKQNNELNLCHSFGGGRLDKPAFLSDREGLLERLPHDYVHLMVGGPNGFMSDLCTSARDPIFLVHHTQTDRIWESWVKAGGKNLLEPKYWNQTFDFFDENGVRNSYRVGDFLDIKALGYRYESLIPSEPIIPVTNEMPKLFVVLNESKDLNINYNKRFLNLHLKPHWNAFFENYANGIFDELNLKFTIQFDIDYLEPDLIFEIYLNLNDRTVPHESHPNFIGTMVTFEAHCVPRFQRQILSVSKCYDISDKLSAIVRNGLHIDGHLQRVFNLTFVPKSCDKVYYPNNDNDVIRFNEILIVFFRAEHTLTKHSSYMSFNSSDERLYDKLLSMVPQSEK